ncbi:MAG: hypothetical protein ACM3PT_03465 [Deltaproteobacteria bacterium]
MKNVIFLLTFTIFTIGAVQAQSKKKVAKLPSFTVENFEKKAEKFIGKPVYISGTVDHVCKHSGKKLYILGKNDEKVEVLAGDIERFPKELEGEDIKVKGTVMEERIDEEYLKEWETEIKSEHKDGSATCATEMEKIKATRDKMKKNKKGYVPIYYLEGISYEKF